MKFDIPKCKHCGGSLKFEKNMNGKWVPIHLEDQFKVCKPKVKIYTKAEIEKMNAELREKSK